MALNWRKRSNKTLRYGWLKTEPVLDSTAKQDACSSPYSQALTHCLRISAKSIGTSLTVKGRDNVRAKSTADDVTNVTIRKLVLSEVYDPRRTDVQFQIEQPQACGTSARHHQTHHKKYNVVDRNRLEADKRRSERVCVDCTRKQRQDDNLKHHSTFDSTTTGHGNSRHHTMYHEENGECVHSKDSVQTRSSSCRRKGKLSPHSHSQNLPRSQIRSNLINNLHCGEHNQDACMNGRGIHNPVTAAQYVQGSSMQGAGSKCSRISVGPSSMSLSGRSVSSNHLMLAPDGEKTAAEVSNRFTFRCKPELMNSIEESNPITSENVYGSAAQNRRPSSRSWTPTCRDKRTCLSSPQSNTRSQIAHSKLPVGDFRVTVPETSISTRSCPTGTPATTSLSRTITPTSRATSPATRAATPASRTTTPSRFISGSRTTISGSRSILPDSRALTGVKPSLVNTHGDGSPNSFSVKQSSSSRSRTPGCVKADEEGAGRPTGRSKTSLGHYRDAGTDAVTRTTKSAGPSRPSQEPLHHSGSIDDVNIRYLSETLRQMLHQDQLQKFMATLSPLDIYSRRKVVHFRTDAGNSVFFRCVQMCRELFVKHLLVACSPELELKETFVSPEDGTTHQVTPLWQAAVSGHLPLVQLLLSHGADVNATSDSGSSVLRAACFMSRVHVVPYLLAHHADVAQRNQQGATCLMASVQSQDLLRILLQNGAKVNDADAHGNTALHHAAEDGLLESVKLLLAKGASALLVNVDNCNAVVAAAIHRRREIVEHLLKVTSLKMEEVIEAYEVLGCTVVIVDNDCAGGFHYWQKAGTLKGMNGCRSAKRRTRRSQLAELEQVDEILSIEDLGFLSENSDAFCLQALLVYERVRGCLDDGYLNFLMLKGACYADSKHSKRAYNLWKTAYSLHSEKFLCETSRHFNPCNQDTMKNIQFLIRLFFQARRELRQTDSASVEHSVASFMDESTVRKLLQFAVDHVSTIRNHLQSDVSHSPDTSFQTLLVLTKLCLCIFALYMDMFPRKQDRDVRFVDIIQTLLGLRVTGPCHESLLHMCLSRDTLAPLGLSEREITLTWPSRAVVDVLLILRADPTETDAKGNSALHYAMALRTYGLLPDLQILTQLLEKGGHADQPNHQGLTASCMLGRDDQARVWLQSGVSLKCLASRAVVLYDLNYGPQVPRELGRFVELHRPRAWVEKGLRGQHSSV